MYEGHTAIYALNSYVWKLIETNLGWSKSDYSGAVPIIPSSQQPELMNTKKPFLVYGSAGQPFGNLYVQRRDSVSYNIYGQTAKEVNDVVALIADAFETQDQAADYVNQWLTTERNATGRDRGISFLSVRPIMSGRATAAADEGGLVSAYCMVEIKYVSENNAVTTGFTYTS